MPASSTTFSGFPARLRRAVGPVLLALLLPGLPAGARAMDLDQFFRYVEVSDAQIAPDGRALLCVTQTRNFQKDEIESWVWRVDLAPDAGPPVRLTRSGDDSHPRWAPDSRAFAFLGQRGEDNPQIFLMNAFGGEPDVATHVEGQIRDFAWAPDGRTLYAGVAYEGADTTDGAPLNSDVIRYDRDGRFTEVDRFDLPSARLTTLAQVPYEVTQLAVSPDGARIAYTTFTASGLEEDVRDAEIWTLPQSGGQPKQLTQNYVDDEQELAWSEDGKWIYYVAAGDEAAPENIITQARLYRIAADGGKPEWLTRAFTGSVGCYLLGSPSYLVPRGSRPVLLTAQTGLDAAPAWLDAPTGRVRPAAFAAGITWGYTESPASGRVAFLHSGMSEAPEVWVAESADKLAAARRVTHFNDTFSEQAAACAVTRDIRYRASDGRTIEGLLTLPAGAPEDRKLPLLVSLHGGPEFFVGHYCMPGYDEYRLLAASAGYAVLEPNYRGSYGYGDDFHAGLVGHPVSRPSADVLAGVEELIRQGRVDPDRVAVTGYSYGGYLTNYLITHSTRFRAAGTGAGAANHVSTWGNHDLSAWGEFLFGGNPYEKRRLYEDESPFWLLPRVHTATHIVTGETDTTVPAEEAYQLYRGIRLSGSPVALEVYPDEGHVFNRPSHEREKVRSEMEWFRKYCLEAKPPEHKPTKPHTASAH